MICYITWSIGLCESSEITVKHRGEYVILGWRNNNMDKTHQVFYNTPFSFICDYTGNILLNHLLLQHVYLIAFYFLWIKH